MTRGWPRTVAPLAVAVTLTAVGCAASGAEETDDIAAQPGTPHVQLVYLDHPPVAAALEDIEEVLAGYADAVTVERIDAESDAGVELADTHDLGDHVAIAILIDGQVEVEAGGQTVDLTGFPDGSAPIPSAEGTWTLDDLDAALRERVADR